MKLTRRRTAVIVLALTVLCVGTACGARGGDTPSSPPNPRAQMAATVALCAKTPEAQQTFGIEAKTPLKVRMLPYSDLVYAGADESSQVPVWGGSIWPCDPDSRTYLAAQATWYEALTDHQAAARQITQGTRYDVVAPVSVRYETGDMALMVWVLTGSDSILLHQYP